MTKASLLFVTFLSACANDGLSIGDGGTRDLSLPDLTPNDLTNVVAPDCGLPCQGCPQAPPASGATACGNSAEQCFYNNGQTRCDCDPSNGGLVWLCNPAACPNPPGPQGACTQPGLVCDYGLGSYAQCIGPENQWLWCESPNMCPPDLPQDGSPCCGSVGETGCGYPGSGCDHSCSCLNNHWSCSLECPPVDLAMSRDL
jgi:hypothetical protein